ncbi:MAG TPA: amidase domain-containing protein [Pseudonocardiaceae bacterium]
MSVSRTVRPFVVAAAAAAGMATAITPTASGAPGAAPEATPQDRAGTTSLGQSIVDWAYREYNDPAHNREFPLGSNCNFYSGVMNAGAPACGNGMQAPSWGWCANFAEYVWKNGGANTSGLNNESTSFKQYGQARGTWSNNLAAVQPGDAVLFENGRPGSPDLDHVGVAVTGWDGSGVWIIEGNSHDRVYKRKVSGGNGAIGFARPVPR